MADELSSLNIDLLSAHLESGEKLSADVDDDRTELSSFEADVVAGCPSNYWDGKGVALLGELLGHWSENHAAAAAIRDTVAVDASGQVSIADDVIEMALRQHGHERAPDEVSIELGESVGLLPLSGFADDPVCTFNGNFIYEETDLTTAGFAKLIDVHRTYNSLMYERRGLFGRGWTTALDMAVVARAGGLSVTVADGAVVPFVAKGDSPSEGYAPNLRRGLVVEAKVGGGWTLHKGSDQRWFFDDDGLLVGGERGGGAFTVHREDRSVTVTESTSGRSVRYELNAEGLVGNVTTSDGRTVDYRYRTTHCVAALRATGDVTYEVADDRIAAVVDADGVVLCRNTYDEQGRIAAQRSPHGTEATYTYEVDNVTRLTYSHDGAVNVYVHDPQGCLVAMFGGDGRAMRTTFDQSGRAVRVVDRTGGSFTYAYDDDHYLAAESGQPAEQAPNDPVLRDQWTRRSDALGSVEERFFDERGRLLRHIDANGGVHGYRYELNHTQPVAVVNPMGGESRLELDHNGLVVGIVDADRYGQRLERNRDGLVKIVVDSAGQFLTHSYDDAARLVSVRDDAGKARSQRLDDGGRVIGEEAGDGQVRSYRYSSAGRMTACEVAQAVGVADQRAGGSWVAHYGSHGELVAFTDSAGETIAFDYDNAGNPTTLTLPDGGRFLTEFDSLGQVVASTDPAGNRFELNSDSAGRRRTITDSQGARWAATFDVANRLISQTDPIGTETRFAYHPGGQLAECTPVANTTGSGGPVRYEINAAGWTTTVVEPDGGRTTTEYSQAGRILAQVSPAGRSVTFRYDDGGNLCATVDEDGVESAPPPTPNVTDEMVEIPHLGVHGVYEAPSPLSPVRASVPAQLDPALLTFGVDRPPVAAEVWAALHQHLNGARADLERITAVWDGAVDATPAVATETSSQVRDQRDQRGLVGRVADPAGTVTDFVNDAMGRPISISSADGATTLIGYGPIGGVSSLTNPLGQTTTAERSLPGRVQRVRFADGTGLDYSYDLLGRIVAVSGSASGGSAAGQACSYRYGPDGQVAEAATPDGVVTASHGPNGELRGTTGLDRASVTYVHDADGLLIRRTRHYPNAAAPYTTTYQRSRGGRLVALFDTEAGEVELPVADDSQRDRANRIVADRHGRTHRYDDAGRLIESLDTEGHRWRFSYGPAGLLTREDHPHRGRRYFDYNTARQLVAVRSGSGVTATFRYDAAGRRTTAEYGNGERVIYRWRGLHHLVGIERVDGEGRASTRRIAYSGFGRPEVIDPGTANETAVGWDDGLSGKPVEVGHRRYLRSGLDVRSVHAGAEWSDGTVADPWGDSFVPGDGDGWVPDNAVGVGLGYRNELCIDGLIFMGDRVYEPASRSFLTADPLPAVRGANAYTGVYAYANNDPVNFVDPSGRRPLTVDEFAEKRAELERSRLGRFAHPVTKWVPTVGMVLRMAPELVNTVGVVGLSYVAGSAAERVGLGDEWNYVYGNYILPGTVQRLYAAADGQSDHNNRGDRGGTFDAEVRQPFLAAGETGEERGANALVRGLDDTGNGNQIQTDEFEIIDHGNGSYTVVLPGVTDLSNMVLGFDPYDQSVRDTDQGAAYSMQSASIDDNIYAAYVAEYLNTSDVPPGADLMIIGHSYGADTAMDLAADEAFTDRYNVTHVVAAGYHSGPQAPFVDADTQVLVLENTNDRAVTVEAIGHGPFVEDDVNPNTLDNVVYRGFDGGNVGHGHHQDNYADYMLDADDPEMAEFYRSVDSAGFTRPGRADAVDISLKVGPQ